MRRASLEWCGYPKGAAGGWADHRYPPPAVKRRGLGRDIGLAVRMVLALVPLAVLYLLGLVVALLSFVAVVVDGSWAALLGWFVFAAGVVLVVVNHWLRAEDLVLRAARGKRVEDEEEPELRRIVDRVAAMADVPPPRLALIRSWAPNALAAGLRPESATIAVTTELLRRLDEQELEAVVAHELAHIANRDGLVMTFVSGPAMLGSGMLGSSDGRAQVFYVLLYWPVHLLGLLLLWTISRYREYVADRGAVVITGAPEHLMSALTKISEREPRGDLRGGAAVSALCIVPAQRKTRLDAVRRFEVFMDHPRLEKRLERLSELARQLGAPAP
jgi:heat shock protein HtpX